MLDLELIKNILIIAMACSIVTTAIVQKIKEGFVFKKSNRLVIISFIVSMVVGTLMSLSFSDANIINSLWAGLFSFIGADTLYKIFEEKIFTPFSDIHKKDTVEISKNDFIK